MYTGREKDVGNLYYYRARYYNDDMNRFISQDPIGLAGGLNWYAYANGNPIQNTDELGLWVGWDDAVAIVGGGIIGVGGELISNAINGQRPTVANLGASFIGGAAAAETFLYTGNPFLAGAVGGGATSLLKSGFNGTKVDGGQLLTDTAIGAATGKFGTLSPKNGLGRMAWDGVKSNAERALMSQAQRKGYGLRAGAYAVERGAFREAMFGGPILSPILSPSAAGTGFLGLPCR